MIIKSPRNSIIGRNVKVNWLKTIALGLPLVTLAAPALADQTTVEVSTVGGGRLEAIFTAIEPVFEGEHPNILLEHLTFGDNWEPLLQATLRQSLINDLPDVSHQALNYTGLLVERGVARPLNSFIEAEGGWEAMGLAQAMREAVTYNGSIYALPFATTVPVLYVNMDLLREVGYEGTQPPSDWDEIFALASAVDALGDNIIGIHLEYTASSAWMFQTFLMGNGGRMMNDDQSDIAFDSEEGLQALELIARFGDSGAFDITRNQARQAFNAGVMGFNVRSASGIPSVSEAAEGNFALQVVQLPTLSEDGILPGAGNGLMMFTDDPEEQAAAWEYMRFAVSPAGQTIMATTTGYVPINLQAIEDPNYLGEYFDDNPAQAATVAQLSRVGDWFAFPGENSQRIFDMMIEQQRQLVTGETTPEAALDFMSEQTRSMLAN